MTLKRSSTIYFKKSLSTRAPPSHEVLKAIMMLTQILLMLQEIQFLATLVPISKGQTPTPDRVAPVLPTLPWLILICTTVPASPILTLPTLSSRNCIETL